MTIADFSSTRILPVGETEIYVEFGKTIEPEIHKKVKAFTSRLDQSPFPGMIEYVAAFASVTVFYDPYVVRNHASRVGTPVYRIVTALLQHIVNNLDTLAEQSPRIVEIPVCYGGEFGPDLEYVAQHTGLTVSDVIDVHSGGNYLVYMLGFAPGFPYLGGMSERIATPRRASPRTAIPAGSVGIAGMQTGMYPIATPGGWQLIGRTPVKLFRPQDNPPTLLQAGDVIRFYPITPEEFKEFEEGHL